MPDALILGLLAALLPRGVAAAEGDFEVALDNPVSRSTAARRSTAVRIAGSMRDTCDDPLLDTGPSQTRSRVLRQAN